MAISDTDRKHILYNLLEEPDGCYVWLSHVNERMILVVEFEPDLIFKNGQEFEQITMLMYTVHYTASHTAVNCSL